MAKRKDKGISENGILSAIYREVETLREDLESRDLLDPAISHDIPYFGANNREILENAILLELRKIRSSLKSCA